MPFAAFALAIASCVVFAIAAMPDRSGGNTSRVDRLLAVGALLFTAAWIVTLCHPSPDVTF